MLRYVSIFCALAVSTLALVGCKNEDAATGAASQIGESCERTSDCGVGLACFSGTCQPADSKVVANAKECKAIQCETASDCCAVAWQKSTSCATWEEECALSPTTYASYCAQAQGPQCACSPSNYACDNNRCRQLECTTPTDCCATRWTRSSSCVTAETYCAQDPVLYASYCLTATGPTCVCNDTVYNYGCTNNICTAVSTCTTDASCSSTYPKCSAGHCVRCTEDTDCPTTGSKCISNSCITPQCITNSDCPVFSACDTDTATCKRVGCATDRECMTELGSYLATCNKSSSPVPTCEVSCERDSQCATTSNPLRVCAAGRCQDPGCETDEECKIRLDTATTTATKGMQYVCRDKVAL